MTGPNTRPILPVPRRCTTKSPTRIATDDRDDEALERGRGDLEALDGAEHRDGRRDQAVAVEQRRAEHAERDDAAGDVPVGVDRCSGMTSAVRARMPPSPWLSARITSGRYLIEMMMISAQNTSEATPSALASVTARSVVLERLPEGVQRAGADVAVDDPERTETQRRDARLRPKTVGFA